MGVAGGAHLIRDPVRDLGEIGALDGDESALVGIALHADDAAADQVVTVDKDEPSGNSVLPVGVEREHGAGAKDDLRYLVAFHPVGRGGAQVVGVDGALDRLHLDRDLPGIELERVRAAHLERPAAEPEEARTEYVGLDRRRLGVTRERAALEEDGLIEREADRLAGAGGLGRVP